MRLRRGRLRRYVTVQKGPLLRPPGAKTRLSLWLVHYGRKVAAVNASAKGVSQRKLAADPGFSSAATCPYLASQVEAQHLDGRADVALGVLFAGVVLGVFSPLTVATLALGCRPSSSCTGRSSWWRWGAKGERAAWSPPSSTCRPSTTETETRDSLLFERAAS